MDQNVVIRQGQIHRYHRLIKSVTKPLNLSLVIGIALTAAIICGIFHLYLVAFLILEGKSSTRLINTINLDILYAYVALSFLFFFIWLYVYKCTHFFTTLLLAIFLSVINLWFSLPVAFALWCFFFNYVQNNFNFRTFFWKLFDCIETKSLTEIELLLFKYQLNSYLLLIYQSYTNSKNIILEQISQIIENFFQVVEKNPTLEKLLQADQLETQIFPWRVYLIHTLFFGNILAIVLCYFYFCISMYSLHFSTNETYTEWYQQYISIFAKICTVSYGVALVPAIYLRKHVLPIRGVKISVYVDHRLLEILENFEDNNIGELQLNAFIDSAFANKMFQEVTRQVACEHELLHYVDLHIARLILEYAPLTDSELSERKDSANSEPNPFGQKQQLRWDWHRHIREFDTWLILTLIFLVFGYFLGSVALLRGGDWPYKTAEFATCMYVENSCPGYGSVYLYTFEIMSNQSMCHHVIFNTTSGCYVYIEESDSGDSADKIQYVFILRGQYYSKDQRYYVGQNITWYRKNQTLIENPNVCYDMETQNFSASKRTDIIVYHFAVLAMIFFCGGCCKSCNVLTKKKNS
ncbi:hypothetical protein RFI_28083 [Reticulomyxa filosa]|uniref:Uncharacterized protein n=1 Tax=Reticulomyxa filosa TaxID=46433 RepID=X6M8E8_RETFI|nr:hypothetical protein RFI_28083 [Reticulomyxa filosa]|eukprot:ETO09300.1 hypothetical protein RFI_28083 [Reticulomyxa filosa]